MNTSKDGLSCLYPYDYQICQFLVLVSVPFYFGTSCSKLIKIIILNMFEMIKYTVQYILSRCYIYYHIMVLFLKMENG